MLFIANSLIFSQLSVWFVTEMFSLLRQLTVLDETNVFADYQGNTQWPDIVAYAKTPAGFDDNGNIQYQAPSFSVNVCTDKNIFVNEYFSLLFFSLLAVLPGVLRIQRRIWSGGGGQLCCLDHWARASRFCRVVF